MEIVMGGTIKAPKIIIYGVPGIGKTTWAADAPKPIFSITEDGIGKNKVPHFPLAMDYDTVLDQVGWLYEEKHDYETFVLDGLDFLEPLVWDHVSLQHGKENIEDFGYQKGYTFAADAWRTLLQGLDALRDEKGMAIILIAHSDIKRFESPETEPYDRYALRLHKKAAAMISDWSDAILFANYKVFTQKTEAGFNKTIVRGTGRGDRVLYTEERPAYNAKNRYALPHELKLDWAAFAEALTEEEEDNG